ncbi:MAG: Multidrug resistance protein MdtK [Firmicutes bacterium ADurb.Bin193]|nr:MAG: Multidrug resistance protein MdtK [Firmicutes bacterium ADurb.Bin193]
MLKKSDFGRIAEVLKVALPCIFEQFMLILINMVTVIIIGHIGSKELVATSMTNQLVNWLQCVFIGLAGGGTIVIARMWGLGEIKEAKEGFKQNLLLSIIISLVILFLSFVFQRQILSFFFGRAEPDVVKLARIYFSFSMIAMPASAVISVINGCVRGVGDNKTALYSTTALIITNLILCFVFVRGVAPIGIAPMGIVGAGIAVVSSKYITALFAFALLYIKKSPVLPERIDFSFKREIVLRMIRIGLPTALEQLAFQGGFVILQTILIGFGTVFQGGYQIGGTVNGLALAPCAGLNIAVTALISNAIGQRDYKKADELVRTSRQIAIGLFSLFGLVLIVFAPYIVRLFTSDPEVIKSGKIFIRMFGSLTLPIAYNQAMSGVLKGGGDVKYISVTTVTGLWLVRILGLYILSRVLNNGYLAVIICVPSDFVFRSVMYHFRVNRGQWRYIRI